MVLELGRERRGSWLVSKIYLSGPRFLRDPAFKKKKEVDSAWGTLEGCSQVSTFMFTPANRGMCTHMYIHVHAERNWTPSIHSFVHACTHGGSLIHSGVEW